ncbi:hypothetical protein SESBI_15780 [Sesbania bispinosa]|nr:hypothetical protein SESBI_15780 [Sesbania bispinosa]
MRRQCVGDETTTRWRRGVADCYNDMVVTCDNEGKKKKVVLRLEGVEEGTLCKSSV